MAIPVFDATGGAHGAGVSSLTFSQVCSADAKILLVGIMFSGGGTVSGVTYNSVGLTRFGSVIAGTLISGDLWYLLNPSSGTHNVVVSHTTSPGDFTAVSCSYLNVDTGDPFGNSASDQDAPFGSGTGDPVTVNVASNSNELVVDVLSFVCGAELVEGAGQTQRNVQTEDVSYGVTMSDETGATTTTMSWTWSPATSMLEWILRAVALKGTAVGGGGIVYNLQIG